MKINIQILILFIIALNLHSQENSYIFPYSDGIPKEQFAERRQILSQNFSDKSLLIFLSADYYLNKRDISSKTLISPNLYYLSGMPPQRAVFIIVPNGFEYNGKRMEELMFINTQTKENVVWNGPGMTTEIIRECLGIENTFELNELDNILTLILKDRDSIFIDRLSHTKHFSSADNSNECEIEIINKIKQQNQSAHITDRIPFINDMRQIKNKFEIEIMQKAIDISIEGHKSAIKNAKPGMFEYQFQSFMEFEFLNRGAERPAYSSIVGTGINSCYLHYMNNSAKSKAGDLVLMDCGAKYHGYCADITRTFPVSGKFTDEQKILYNIVLEARDSALTACRPGIEFSKIHEKAKELIKTRLTKLGIVTESEKVDTYFPHGTSHFLGLDVHDVANKRVLEPGMVLTVEPGIYIPEGSNCDKKWWNNGIRIEDNILITDYGYKNLSEKMPKTIDEIEKLISDK